MWTSKSSVTVACFRAGRAKDLSAPFIYINAESWLLPDKLFALVLSDTCLHKTVSWKNICAQDFYCNKTRINWTPQDKEGICIGAEIGKGDERIIEVNTLAPKEYCLWVCDAMQFGTIYQPT